MTDIKCITCKAVLVGEREINTHRCAATQPIKETDMPRTSTVHHCADGTEYKPGAFESCIHCNPPSEEQLAQALEYYLERAATEDEVNMYRDALTNNPDLDMAEFVDALRAL